MTPIDQLPDIDAVGCKGDRPALLGADGKGKVGKIERKGAQLRLFHALAKVDQLLRGADGFSAGIFDYNDRSKLVQRAMRAHTDGEEIGLRLR